MRTDRRKWIIDDFAKHIQSLGADMPEDYFNNPRKLNNTNAMRGVKQSKGYLAPILEGRRYAKVQFHELEELMEVPAVTVYRKLAVSNCHKLTALDKVILEDDGCRGVEHVSIGNCPKLRWIPGGRFKHLFIYGDCKVNIPAMNVQVFRASSGAKLLTLDDDLEVTYAFSIPAVPHIDKLPEGVRPRGQLYAAERDIKRWGLLEKGYQITQRWDSNIYTERYLTLRRK